MGEILEITKVLVSPVMKLMNLIGGAIGKAYEPRNKRKMADSVAYEINTVADAMRKAADLPVVYDKNGVAINSEDFMRLMHRAGTRLALQETIKQNNIEAVVDNAYEILEKEEECSKEPVGQSWINRFFDSVADISDEDLQKLWGKILAGEIKQPSSYSLRTLDTLKNLSKSEAMLFQKIIPYVLCADGILFLTSITDILNKYGITYNEIIQLDECGLINSAGQISLKPKISRTNRVAIHNKAKLLLLHGINIDNENVSIGEFGLTRAGKELYGILDGIPNEEYLLKFANEIVKRNSGKVTGSIYQINSINEGGIEYNETILYEFPVKD